MRLVAVVLAALAFAGCFEGERCKNSSNPLAVCSYGFSGVTAHVTYTNATWDTDAQWAALRALGYEASGSASTVVVGRQGNETVRFYDHPTEIIQVDIQFSDERGLGYTPEEANAMSDSAILVLEPRAMEIVANLTRALGWPEPGPMWWARGIIAI